MHLVQYAVMGNAYAREVLGKPKPRVGLLSIGTEETKGNELTFETYKLCKRIDLNFLGHVEGHDLFSNRVDVVVCDGFVGNVVLKTCESLASNLVAWVKKELVKNPIRMLGAFLAKGAFKSIKQRMDPDTHGGAPLLGLNGTVMIAHGAARQHAIMCAIRTTSQAVHHHLDQVITKEIAAANARLSMPAAAASA
jgi:glycerol-3-phosphate acyltransferase PlsX